MIEVYYVKEPFNNGWSELLHMRPNELVQTIFDLEIQISNSLVFDPKNKLNVEALTRANLDWECTLESHKSKRLNSYLFAVVFLFS